MAMLNNQGVIYASILGSCTYTRTHTCTCTHTCAHTGTHAHHMFFNVLYILCTCHFKELLERTIPPKKGLWSRERSSLIFGSCEVGLQVPLCQRFACQVSCTVCTVNTVGEWSMLTTEVCIVPSFLAAENIDRIGFQRCFERVSLYPSIWGLILDDTGYVEGGWLLIFSLLLRMIRPRTNVYNVNCFVLFCARLMLGTIFKKPIISHALLFVTIHERTCLTHRSAGSMTVTSI